MASDTEVPITIYGMKGQRRWKLQRGMVMAGRYVTADHVVYWDGRGEEGESIASGTYLYQLQAGDYTDTRKMVILK